MTACRRTVTVLLALALALASAYAPAGAAPASAAGTSTTTAAPTGAADATAVAGITATFDGFLAAPDVATQIKYVENGDALTAVLTKTAEVTAGVKLAVKVANLTATVEGTTAKFTYDLAAAKDGTILLPGQSGEAVLVHGVWLITGPTICDLTSAGAPQYANECLAAASQAAPPAAPSSRRAANGVGVTKTSILIGGVAAKTGSAESPDGDAFLGVRAYVKWFNAKGGIYGRKLKIVSERDDANRASQDISQARALVELDKVFAILPVATRSFAGATYLAGTETPVFGWNINAEWMKGKNLFGQSGSRSVFDEGGTYLPYLAKQLGATKVGIMDYEGAAQSKDCATGQEAGYKKYGLDVAYKSTGLNFGFTDLSGEIAKMRRAGVQFLSTCMDLDGNVSAAKAIKQAGLDIKIYSPQGYDATTPKKYGSAVDGFYFGTIFRPFEAVGSNKAEKLYLAEMKKDKYPTNELTLVGWINGMLFTRALEDAGPNFTQQKVIDAANKMSNWTAGGILVPVDYTQWPRLNVRKGAVSCTASVQVRNGKFVPVFGKPGKPFACFPANPQPANLSRPTFL